MSSENESSKNASSKNDVQENVDGNERLRDGIRGLKSFGRKINLPQSATGRMEVAASNLSKMKKSLNEKARAKKDEIKATDRVEQATLNFSRMKQSLNEKAKAKKEELKIKKEEFHNRRSTTSSHDNREDDTKITHDERNLSEATNQEVTIMSREIKEAGPPKVVDETPKKEVIEVVAVDEDIKNIAMTNIEENTLDIQIVPTQTTQEYQSNSKQQALFLAQTFVMEEPSNNEISVPDPHGNPNSSSTRPASEPVIPSTSIPSSNPRPVSHLDLPQTTEHNKDLSKKVRKRDKIKGAIGKIDVKFSSLKEKKSNLPNLGLSQMERPFRQPHLLVRENEDGITEYRLKPFLNNEEPKYMSEKQIYQNSLKPTDNFFMLQSSMSESKGNDATKQPLLSTTTMPFNKIWNDPKDGRIGSLCIEVLGAMGFQKFDRFNKPNVFVNLVCGDSHFVTDVIPSTNAPMWPSCSKRAAVFPIFHAYARLFLGVFHEVKKEKVNDRFLGRTIVDVSALRSNSLYDAWMPLKSSAFVYDRKPRGAIHLRFSVHWFNERSVILSYLSAPKYGELTSIPITSSDPKEFRNLVLTSYGEDLPRKYSPPSFQALMREVALYRVQIEYQVQHFLRDTALYKRPFISLYLFIAWMHCVYLETVRYIPPYLMGFWILHLIRNYIFYCSCVTGHSGFKPLTIHEMINSLVFGCGESGGKCGKSMKPLNLLPDIEKVASSSSSDRRKQFQDMTMEGADHMTFPFSERQSYRQLTLAESLADKRKMTHTSLARGGKNLESRPSSIPGSDETPIDANRENDEYDEDKVVDTEEIDFESFDNESDDESDYDVFGHNLKESIPHLKKGQSFPAGPQQDINFTSKKPVQVRQLLMHTEHVLQSATWYIFNQQYYRLENNAKRHVKKNEFMTRLGVKKKSTNPIVNYSAQYLEPIMSMVNVFLSMARLLFNISTWKDPILSFWVLMFFTALMLILIVFPWKQFFFVMGIVTLGPQNFVIGLLMSDGSTAVSDDSDDNKDNEGVKNRKRDKAKKMLTSSKNKLKNIINNKRDGAQKNATMELDSNIQNPDSTLDKSVINEPKTCDVLVPYTRFRMDRFYYWPPDPTFSKAENLSLEKIESITDNDSIFFSFEQSNNVDGNDSYGTFQN